MSVTTSIYTHKSTPTTCIYAWPKWDSRLLSVTCLEIILFFPGTNMGLTEKRTINRDFFFPFSRSKKYRSGWTDNRCTHKQTHMHCNMMDQSVCSFLCGLAVWDNELGSEPGSKSLIHLYLPLPLFFSSPWHKHPDTWTFSHSNKSVLPTFTRIHLKNNAKSVIWNDFISVPLLVIVAVTCTNTVGNRPWQLDNYSSGLWNRLQRLLFIEISRVRLSGLLTHLYESMDSGW